ncbi:MAG: MFS transporter [Flectobacillus sp.]|uniref:MFS transporter n=1 Tax=Flectobacillus sp. TaxID=50419 RepID=UPI003B9BBE0B
MFKSFRHQQWKMLLLTMVCYLFFYTGRHNFGWAARGLSEHFHVPYSTIGWISFSMLIGYAIGQFANGNLADQYSAKILMPLGAYLSIITNIAISFVETIEWVLVLWALNGFFQSMAWAPGGKLIANWWDASERGKAYSFYTMAAGLSSVITYLICIYILQETQSWRMLFRLPVLILFVTATIYFIFAKNQPSDLGYPNFEENADTDVIIKENWKTRYHKVLSNRDFMLVVLAFAFESMARYGFIFWVPVHYLGKDWKQNTKSLWLTFLLPLGMAVGALVFGALSDNFFKRNRVASIRFGMLMSSAIASAIYFTPIHHFLLQGIIMFLAGLFVYGPQSNFWTLCPEMLGHERTGTGIGLMNMFGYLFAALGEPLFGKILDTTGNSANIFLMIVLISLFSALIISWKSLFRIR